MVKEEGIGQPRICAEIETERSMEDKLTDIWQDASPKERAEFVAGLCKSYASLICEILKKQGGCPASSYLFGKKVGD